MEFKFNLNEVFGDPIMEIGHDLVPLGFNGDRRQWITATKMVSDMVNAIGEASARAQGLAKSITTAERFRKSENQKLYLLIDPDANKGNGAVIGMLKIGQKKLYVLDREDNSYQVLPPCVLDFYIHESRQRNGLGKELFQYMLEKENIEPVQMALDRPSDKLLKFLEKYYGLKDPIHQINNFVVFDDFFADKNKHDHNIKSCALLTQVSENNTQNLPLPYGRYGAHKPTCSMGKIIHNETSTINEYSSPSETKLPVEKTTAPKLERPQSLSLQQEDQPDVEEKDDGEKPAENDVDEVATKVESLGIENNHVENDDLALPGDGNIMQTARKTPSHLTEQGFFDLKFYHNKLW